MFLWYSNKTFIFSNRQIFVSFSQKKIIVATKKFMRKEKKVDYNIEKTFSWHQKSFLWVYLGVNHSASLFKPIRLFKPENNVLEEIYFRKT